MDLCTRWWGREFQKKLTLEVTLKWGLYEEVSHFNIGAVAVVKLFQALDIPPHKSTEGYRLQDLLSVDVAQHKSKYQEEMHIRANALFHPCVITWTLQKTGKRSPWHTEQLFRKYHQELIKVKIEGWEVKHIELKKLSENSLCQYKASKDVQS